MDKLINSFSIENLKAFFMPKGLKPDSEDFSYIIKEKDFNSFSNLLKIGEINFNNSEDLLVFACKYNGELSEKSSKKKQFEIAKKVLKEDFKDGAIFVFYDSLGCFRFSFLRRNSGEKEKYSNWKRYTYFIDPNKKTNNTFREQIGKKCDFKSLDSIQGAFRVEELTKNFYKELFNWYQWTLTDEIGITFPNNTNTSEDDRLKLEEQIIRLITRLLFVWFIKQKQLVPDNFFKIEELSKTLKDFDPYSTTEGNYYNAILQNLFFATLNRAVPEREFAKVVDRKRDIKTRYRYAEMFSLSKQEEIISLFCSVPFLNGGLFECLDKEESTDGVKYHLDGFSRSDKKFPNGNFKHRAFIPNCVFFDEDKGLIPLLERYNFTIEENSPNEIQIALDPELLGNVFENLLGAFNPETKETARKQSGSFYTPKEIVAYMVDESLIAYLNNDLPKVEENIIHALFAQEDLPDVLINNVSLREKIFNKLRAIKILDPACGSGAFPMGILNRLVEILEKLDNKNKDSHYDLKLHLIEECIYGIDIQTIAVQISKLRFFISLIVEQEKDETKDNYGIIPLPNLETKFVAANTLIGIKKKKEGEFVSTLFTDPRIDETKHKLMKVRKEHFYAKSTYKKKELRDEDAILREQLSKLLQDNNEFAPEDAIQFAQWNPYDQNSSSPFFDTEWMFGMEEGFDVVIGNPPYFSLTTDSNVVNENDKRIKHNKLYEPQGYKVFKNNGDIYSLFYEKGWQLLKQKGVLCYITSNKWMRAGYGENTRKFFAENTNPILLIDFAGQKIFESATVNTNILLFSKDKNRQQTKACIVKEKMLHNLRDLVMQITSFNTSDSWIILTEIEQRIKTKIEAVGTPLKDWDINIYRGILTGYNEAFIIDGKKKEELIAEDPKSAEIIRPILRGKDIKKYGYDFANLWLINTHNGIKEKDIKPIEIEDYPAIKNHLNLFYPQLEKRADQGNTPYNLRNCSYIEDFYKQKIVWNRIASEKLFSLVDEGIVIQDSMHFFTGNHLAYLCGILNSKLFKWFIYLIIGDAAGGNAGNSDNIKNLTIPQPKEENEQLIKKYMLTQQYNKIDNIIYQIYNLSQDEIKFIDSQ